VRRVVTEVLISSLAGELIGTRRKGNFPRKSSGPPETWGGRKEGGGKRRPGQREKGKRISFMETQGRKSPKKSQPGQRIGQREKNATDFLGDRLQRGADKLKFDGVWIPQWRTQRLKKGK